MNRKAADYPYLYAFRADDELSADLDDAIKVYGEMPVGTALRLLLEEPAVRERIRLRANAYRAASRLGSRSARQAERTD